MGTTEYGTDEADYWVYAFVPCKLNRDARTDLYFYSGDDTSEEIIILENRGSAFKVYSRKEKALDEWAPSNKSMERRRKQRLSYQSCVLNLYGLGGRFRLERLDRSQSFFACCKRL